MVSSCLMMTQNSGTERKKKSLEGWEWVDTFSKIENSGNFPMYFIRILPSSSP